MKTLIKKALNKETISYTIFGVLTTVVDYIAAYILFYKLGFSDVISNTIAWVLAVAFAYITNKIFVFNAKETDFKTIVREIITFAGARVVTLIITNAFIVFAKTINIDFLLAKVIISVVVIILNYFFSKIFIFKKDSKKNGGYNE